MKDNTSGSTQILINAISIIKDFVKRDDVSLSSDLYMEISKQLISAQPSMGIILNLANKIESIKKLMTKKDFLFFLDNYKSEVQTHKAIIAKRVLGLIKDNSLIMIYSSSSTVFESLKYAHNNGLKFKVMVLESRPMNEGRKMMLLLSRLSIPVIFVTDAVGISMLARQKVDTVFVGGDAILTKYFVCKIGTYPIAMLCKQNNIQIYGLCETEKIIPKKFETKFVILDKQADEITTYRNKFVKVINRYFEKVPLKLFTNIITDH